MDPLNTSRQPLRYAGVALVVAVSVMAAGCVEGPNRPRDLILVTVDTLRFDATGFSGAGKVATPAMDALARSGRVFGNAHAHSVVTLPSHATILSGRYPYEHGVRDNAGFVFPEDTPTLATILADEGYATGAFVSAFPLDRRFGLDRGFAIYDDEYEGYGTSAFTFAERPGAATVARALDWWRSQEGRPRFVWVHLFTPHFPYAPEEPFASKYADAPYYGDVAMTDAQLAPLLQPLIDDDASNAVVVLTSDHGESLGEHGEQTHGLFAYEATLQVPLVVWAPGVVEPGVDRTAARHVDVLPTVLDLLGLPVPGSLPGRTLFSDSHPGTSQGSYFEALTAYLNRGWAPLFGNIEGDLKAIDLPLPELYDLQADPGESSNLHGERTGRHEAILAALDPAARQPIDRDRVDPEVVERLRSLGYLAAGGAAPDISAEFGSEDDPKRLVAVESRLYEALGLYRAGNPEAAIRILESMLEDHPRMLVAYGHLGFMYSDLGRTEEAVQTLERALARGMESESIRRKLALALYRDGRSARALEVMEPLVASDDPETQTVLGRIEASLGHVDAARGRFVRALELDPTFPDAQVDQGILLMFEGRFDEAERLLQGGLARNRFLAEGWNALGVIRSRKGEIPAAIDSWRKALDVDPRLPDALFNLGVALGKRGDFSDAIDALERYRSLASGEERSQADRMLEQLRVAAEGSG